MYDEAVTHGIAVAHYSDGPSKTTAAWSEQQRRERLIREMAAEMLEANLVIARAFAQKGQP